MNFLKNFKNKLYSTNYKEAVYRTNPLYKTIKFLGIKFTYKTHKTPDREHNPGDYDNWVGILGPVGLGIIY